MLANHHCRQNYVHIYHHKFSQALCTAEGCQQRINCGRHCFFATAKRKWGSLEEVGKSCLHVPGEGIEQASSQCTQKHSDLLEKCELSPQQSLSAKTKTRSK